MTTGATVPLPWQTVLEGLLRTLKEKGFAARRTFDLQAARKALSGSEAEPCPYHGTAPCSCQYIVIHVGGSDRPFSGIVIHGFDRTTTISFLAAGEEAARDMTAAIRACLQGEGNR